MFTILVAVDHDEKRAKKKAEAITDSPLALDECRIVLTNVAREVRSDEGSPIDLQDYSDMPESVQLIYDHLEAENVSVDLERRSGEPADEILQVVREVDADWIVVGGRKRSPVGKAIFGSTTQELILNAGCSVLVVN